MLLSTFAPRAEWTQPYPITAKSVEPFTVSLPLTKHGTTIVPSNVFIVTAAVRGGATVSLGAHGFLDSLDAIQSFRSQGSGTDERRQRVLPGNSGHWAVGRYHCLAVGVESAFGQEAFDERRVGDGEGRRERGMCRCNAKMQCTSILETRTRNRNKKHA